MSQDLTRNFKVVRSIQPITEDKDLVNISASDDRGHMVQQSFFKPLNIWDWECDRNERMAIKLLIHNLLMK